jgi:hypothetical protein
MAYARVDFNSWTEQEYGVHIEAIAIGAKVLAEDPEPVTRSGATLRG